jgi:outer membrane protein, heavy metal efflux system
MFTRFLAAVLGSAALLSSSASAAELTLAQALDRAAAHSQAWRAARAASAGATETARAAGQLPDPMLSVGVDNLPVTGPERLRTTADSMTMKRIGISQEWVSTEKRALRRAAMDAQVARETLLEQVALADVRLQTALAYLDAYYAGEALELTRLAEQQATETSSVVTTRLASASAGSGEALRAAAARNMAEDEAAEAQQQLASARVALERWLGTPVEGLAPAALPGVPNEQSYVQAHPAVLQAQRDLDAARADAAATAANGRPNWTWQAAYGQRVGVSDMVSVGVSIPLPIAPGERQDRETAAKLALVTRAEALVEEALRIAAAEHRSLASDAQRLAQRAERYRTGVTAVARQRVQAALAGYQSTQVSLSDVFDARQAEVDAQRRLLALQRELAKVQAQLVFKPVSGGVQ